MEYFLDEMQRYELDFILENIEYTSKQDWERARLIAYIQAQSQCSKKLAPTDIIHFKWDDAPKEDTKISTEDIIRLTNKAKRIIETR